MASSSLKAEGGRLKRKEDLTSDILEMNKQWESKSGTPLCTLRSKIAGLDVLSPILILTPGELAMLVCSGGESRNFVIADLLQVYHPQPTFWAVENSEQILLRSVWLCKFYGIESDPMIIRGDCCAEKSMDFFNRLVDKLTEWLAVAHPEDLAMKNLVTESDWSMTENDALFTWDQFLTLAYHKVMRTDAPERLLEGGVVERGRMKFEMKDVLDLDKLRSMGVLDIAGIQKLGSGMCILQAQIGPPDDFIEDSNKLRAAGALKKYFTAKRLIDKMVAMWKANDNFESTKTAFMVAYAGGLVPIFDNILGTQRSFMLDMVHLLEKAQPILEDKDDRGGKDEDEVPTKFIRDDDDSEMDSFLE